MEFVPSVIFPVVFGPCERTPITSRRASVRHREATAAAIIEMSALQSQAFFITHNLHLSTHAVPPFSLFL